MNHFGISHTLARFQLKNSEVGIDHAQAVHAEPSSEWENNESIEVHIFRLIEVE